MLRSAHSIWSELNGTTALTMSVASGASCNHRCSVCARGGVSVCTEASRMHRSDLVGSATASLAPAPAGSCGRAAVEADEDEVEAKESLGGGGRVGLAVG